ncbi:MAG: DUF1127 domain-containing protein [Alphaproteobacteria bacterium]|nr:DUF1127 domain-containing protein [Alphaproteobacteria bacterium]
MSLRGHLASGPLEGVVTWLFTGVVRVARFADRLAAGGLHQLLVWRERSRQRRTLADLNERMRRDIGLGAADIHRECAKPFWLQ